MNGKQVWNLQVSGLWVDWGVSEDCSIDVVWEIFGSMSTTDGPKVKIHSIDLCYGLQTGTNYTNVLQPSRELLEHLSEMITERLEV